MLLQTLSLEDPFDRLRTSSRLNADSQPGVEQTEKERPAHIPDEYPWERAPILTMANSSVSSLDLPIRGASPASSVAGSYTNANGAVNGVNYTSPLPAGHQQDLNYLYEQIQELSNLLKLNRARTAELTKRAEQAEVTPLPTKMSAG